MELKKFLLVLTSTDDQSILPQAVELCRGMGGKLFAMFVIEPEQVAQAAVLAGVDAGAVRDATEEEGWKLLYLVEDDAVENGVWTSLHLMEGDPLELAMRHVETYQIDALLVRRKDGAQRIFVSSSVPVIGL